MKINKDKAKQYIYKTNGKIFSAVFTGKGLAFKPESRGLIGVYDMQKKAYRFISTNTLEQITVQGITYTIKESK